MKRLLFIFTILSAVVMTSCHKGLSSKYPADEAYIDSIAKAGGFNGKNIEFDESDAVLTCRVKWHSTEIEMLKMTGKDDAISKEGMIEKGIEKTNKELFEHGISFRTIIVDEKGNVYKEILITPDDVLP